MKIERLFIARSPGGPLEEASSLRLVAGSGIEGDRYFDARDEPGQNLTLVEAEVIEDFLARHPNDAGLACTRRNVVTRGVRLGDLLQREFTIGGVRLRGVDWCEPCLGLGEALATPEIAPPAVVRHFVHRAGIRADVLSSGTIEVGHSLDGPLDGAIDRASAGAPDGAP